MLGNRTQETCSHNCQQICTLLPLVILIMDFYANGFFIRKMGMINPLFRKQGIVCTHNNGNDKVNDNSSDINIRSYYLLSTCYEIDKITSLQMIQVIIWQFRTHWQHSLFIVLLPFPTFQHSVMWFRAMCPEGPERNPEITAILFPLCLVRTHGRGSDLSSCLMKLELKQLPESKLE